MTVYILSKMANNVAYQFYEKVGEGDIPQQRKRILIHGGADMPSDKSGLGEMIRDGQGRPLWTAAGIVTPVSDADFEELKHNHIFKKHEGAGLLKVLDTDISGNNRVIEKHAATMTDDGFGLLTKDTIQSRVKVSVAQAEDSHRI